MVNKEAKEICMKPRSFWWISTTPRAAFDHGFECWVAHDACATRMLTFQDRAISASDVHASFLAALKAVYAKVLRVDEIIEQLMRAQGRGSGIAPK